jgi:leader peptidase (prepilin peptidase)/N-methyltransferase
MGDVKLLGAMGLYLGPYVLLALMLGSIIGALSGIFLRGPGGLRRKVPFGPFLAIGAIATLVVGRRFGRGTGVSVR